MSLIVDDIIDYPLDPINILETGYTINYHPFAVLHAFPYFLSHLTLCSDCANSDSFHLGLVDLFAKFLQLWNCAMINHRKQFVRLCEYGCVLGRFQLVFGQAFPDQKIHWLGKYLRLKVVNQEKVLVHRQFLRS